MIAPINVGDRKVGAGQPCYVIAEAGSNHDGSLEQAIALIHAAAAAGADAVKFQAIKYDELWIASLETREHRDFYTAVELPEEWLPTLCQASVEQRIHFLCSPTYVRAVSLLDRLPVPAFKIASPQAVGDPLILRAVAESRKSAILSTGYADMTEIQRAVSVLRQADVRGLALLQCVAEYPASGPRVNLRAMAMLAERFQCPVGLSDHTTGIHVAPAAVAMGACIVEKHFTTDRKRRGPDHHFALEPSELAAMVRHIRDVEACMGDGRRDSNTEREREQSAKLQVRAVARHAIDAGARLTQERIVFRRAPAGIPAFDFDALKNPVAAHAIHEGALITPDLIRESDS